MGHKHSRQELLDAALRAALDDGLSQLTFGRLAKRLDISDRVIVYYFPTKHDLIAETITALGSRLQDTIGPAFAEPAADHLDMVRRAWPLVSGPATDRVFALFFEANGLAAIGVEPYATIVPALVEAWIAWAADLLAGPQEWRQAQAATAIATIDGLLLLRLLHSPEIADAAFDCLANG